MSLYHVGPRSCAEQANEAARSGMSGRHVWINCGLDWCQFRLGYWRGLWKWLRLGGPRTGTAAQAVLGSATR